MTLGFVAAAPLDIVAAAMAEKATAHPETLTTIAGCRPQA
jgi:hypothetical protein